MKRVICVISILAGCSSGADGSDAPGFESYTAQVQGVGVTPASQTPERGEHIYQGMMQLNLPLPDTSREQYLGQMSLSIAPDISTIDVTGRATDFETDDADALSGTLEISGGTLLPDADPDRDFLWIADLSGTLADGGTDLTLGARLFGDFYGMEATGVAGEVVGGTIRTSDWDDIFDGAFAAEK